MNLPLTPLDPWIVSKLDQAGPLTREALEAYQLEKLRETLELVRRKSRFYQKRLAAAPRHISSLSDVAQFPFTTAQDIRQEGLQFLCVSQGDIQRVVTLDTSGTTGHPKRLYFTQQDQELTIDFFHIGMSTFTEPGDKVLILLPCERVGSVGDLLAMALLRLGARPVKHGVVRDVSKTLDVMRQGQVNGLVGIPAQVLALARCGEEQKLKSVLLTTDHVPNAITRAVEHAWNCRVYNHYGMTEMGLGGGVECQARRGYHLREADLYFEIVNPATGEAAADGETGEVVFTTLTRRGMPLIRYRTGDLSRFIPGECPCGTALKTLERVRQRASGYVAVGDGPYLTIADLDEALFSVEGLLDFSVIINASSQNVRANPCGQVQELPRIIDKIPINRVEKDCLNIQVSVAERMGTDIEAVVEAALNSIPAIRLARAASQLDIAVTVHKGPAVARPTKRIIADQRTKPG